MKKRNLLIAGMVVLLFGIIPGCDLLEECGTCELVTVASDGTTTYGTPLPYCGEALEEKQNSSPVTVGGTTTYWECY
jgi:hypothetical protein